MAIRFQTLYFGLTHGVLATIFASMALRGTCILSQKRSSLCLSAEPDSNHALKKGRQKT